MAKKAATAFIFLLLAMACASSQPIADDSWPVEMYFRRAQAAFDRKRYKLSLQYYDQVFLRFPDRLDKVAAAEYEQGFVLYRMKRYEEAQERFEAALALFEAPSSGEAPPEWVRSLAQTMQKKNAEELLKQQAKERKTQQEEAVSP